MLVGAMGGGGAIELDVAGNKGCGREEMHLFTSLSGMLWMEGNGEGNGLACRWFVD